MPYTRLCLMNFFIIIFFLLNQIIIETDMHKIDWKKLKRKILYKTTVLEILYKNKYFYF